MEFKHIGFLGLGLIGGSVARSIKRFYPNCIITAYDVNTESLLAAKEEKVIDYASGIIDGSFACCDLIVLSGPVIYNNQNLELLKSIIPDTCLLTDIGSVKQDIHALVKELDLEKQFIGGHPMAGSEKSGFTNSSDHLIENAYYILTPTEQVAKEKVDFLYEFIGSLGSIPLILDCKTHDYVTASISHLPHIVAASLVNLIQNLDSGDELMKILAAGGFKDITRIASSSPVMWQQICTLNHAQILRVMEQYMQTLQCMMENIKDKNKDDIYSFFESAMEYRNSIPDTSYGSIIKTHVIYCDIMDEAGAIATIATILACNHINIKNIGIVHNREFEEGVLRIEFYEESSLTTAADLLEKHRYTVYVR